MAIDKGQAIGWDDEGQVQSSSFEVVPEGEYTYEVVSLKRERFEGSTKMGACPVAALQLRCTNVETGLVATGFCRLFLNSKVLFRISNFFKSCGLIAPDAPDGSNFSMSLFEQVEGCTGRVKVKVTKTTNNGREYENNDFDFVIPEPGKQTQATIPSGGMF